MPHIDPPHETIISLIQKGANIFITGPGGTGKSTLVRKLPDSFGNIAITAMTGCAAILLDCKAKTLHSWAGIGLGLGLDPIEKTLDTINKKRHVKKRWLQTRTLVIDEVSMLTPGLFGMLDTIGRKIRKCPQKPFGGIQLVLVGDFCQLPPVSKEETTYLFESDLWPQITEHVILNKIWRQSDPVYQRILSEVRFGQLTAESETILRSRMNKDWRSEPIQPTLLFSRNSQVDQINTINLNALQNPTHTFKAKTTVDKSRWADETTAPDLDSDAGRFALNKLEQDASFVPTLDLRKDAQVMLLTNHDMDAGLVNGSRGIITGFSTPFGYPIVQFKKGKPVLIEPHTWWSHEFPHIGKMQIPLRVAYAITIHKSQGASIDSAIVDIGKNTFEYGQAYVALSRVRSLDGLYLHALQTDRIRTCPKVIEFYKRLQNKALNTDNTDNTDNKEKPDKTDKTDNKEKQEKPEAWNLSPVHESWLQILRSALNAKPTLESTIAEARKTSKIYPEPTNVFAALALPKDSVKVVILGQDPYHGPNQAIGLAFAISNNSPQPPSLKNIMKELEQDLGKPSSVLLTWPSKGVLLLNTLLTVEDSKPLSHEKIGWESVTDALIQSLASNSTPIVWMLWGRNAQKKRPLITNPTHHILETVHPSPLSAHRGFFGSKHFSKANELLGQNAIQWTKEE